MSLGVQGESTRTLAQAGKDGLAFSLFWMHTKGVGAMGEVHSHQFRPVAQVWLKGEENELSCECGEKLWVIFESPTSPERGRRARFRERLDRFARVHTA